MVHRLVLVFCLISLAFGHSLRNEYIRFKAQPSAINNPVELIKTRRAVPIKSGEKSAATNPDLFFPPLPGQSNNDFHPQLRQIPSDNDTLYYYSWHIHVYFFHENANVTARALALRQEFMKYFDIEKCLGNCFMGAIFDNCTRMCVWDPVMGVDGPHPYGQWGVYLPNELLLDTVSWMSENHGEFEVLFHPNTGLMVGDHDSDRRAMWIKRTVPLDLDFLRWLQCKWFGCSDRL